MSSRSRTLRMPSLAKFSGQSSVSNPFTMGGGSLRANIWCASDLPPSRREMRDLKPHHECVLLNIAPSAPGPATSARARASGRARGSSRGLEDVAMAGDWLVSPANEEGSVVASRGLPPVGHQP